MFAFFHTIRLWLEQNIHPSAPWALLTLGIFAAVYATRKLTPKLWVWFDSISPDGMISHVVQGLPATLGGVLLSVLLTGGDFSEAWKGALAGALAPVLHLILKALPVPYQGAVRAIAAKVGIVALALFFVGCTPQQIQSAIDVANDVEKIAKVLCLLDQAKIKATRADLVGDACSTIEQLGPYLPAAHRMQANPRAFVVQP